MLDLGDTSMAVAVEADAEKTHDLRGRFFAGFAFQKGPPSKGRPPRTAGRLGVSIIRPHRPSHPHRNVGLWHNPGLESRPPLHYSDRGKVRTVMFRAEVAELADAPG